MEAAKVWLLRRMLNLGWTSHTSNQEVFNRIKSEKVMKTILKRQLGYLGHVLRMGGFRNFMPYCERGTSIGLHMEASGTSMGSFVQLCRLMLEVSPTEL